MDSRNPRLKKIFDDVVNGDKQLSDHLVPHFIQGISTHPDPAACLHTIVNSKGGLKAVQTAVCSDLSTESLNSNVAVLLAYLRDSKLECLGGGNTLRRLLRALVESPNFWDSFITALDTGKLRQPAERSCSWLFLQLVLSPSGLAEYRRRMPLRSLIDSSDRETRSNARKIYHISLLYRNRDTVPPDWQEAPGWRHDNDSSHFPQISILPTSDEIYSTERSYLRTVDEIEGLELTSPVKAFEVHVENQFRLLREDLVHDTRDKVQVALGDRKGKHTGFFITGLLLAGVYMDTKSKWGLKLTCPTDFPCFSSTPTSDKGSRRELLANDRNFLRHKSFASLLSGTDIITFVTIIRDVDLLIQYPPVIAVQLEGGSTTRDALFKLHGARSLSLVQISTPLFAYEPILHGLQWMSTQPSPFFLDGTLLIRPHTSRAVRGNLSDIGPGSVPDLIRGLVGTREPITLDDAQTAAFVCGLTQKVTLIQGPPGTGKSFIGALLAKALYELTSHRLMICCYTNHALNQFLEDLVEQGIPEEDIVRLGSKPSTKTANMALSSQTHAYRFSKYDWDEIESLRGSLGFRAHFLRRAFSQYETQLGPSELLDHLESTHPTHFEAVCIPPADDEMILIGGSGKTIGKTYLLSRWLNGRDAGVFSERTNMVPSRSVWDLSPEERKVLGTRWKNEILEKRVEAVLSIGDDFNEEQAPIDWKYQESSRRVISSKRIIACTTTGAAIFRDAIDCAEPEILMVEEAGEVLESHVLTALGDKMKQLILIGDHKQLRPKVNNYDLTVEKGDGYDLNRSLFERLVKEGHPYRALSKQHRMRPEISALIRHLTYPNLTDGPGTGHRPPIRGLQNTVIFIDHDHSEDDDSSLFDPLYLGTTTSKRNKFEVDMVVKIVRYLKQQGYDSDKITVLTPYLGQLVGLRATLQTNNEVAVGEMDAEQLEVAGLSDLLGKLGLAGQRKKPLKVATIDNYQGEENDIIVASLTRSNKEGNIGFMSSPERLNVLLSRARLGLVMIGNSRAFLKSRSGKEIWSKFFDMIKRLGYFYEGLPVRCEQHNDARDILRLPEDFERLYPEGGCSEPCNVTMSCGIHTCLRKCHNLQDHDDLTCLVRVQTELPCGHKANHRCHKSQAPSEGCVACELVQRKAGVGKVIDENEVGTDDRPSVSVDPRPTTSPTSPWRARQTATTTDNGIWGGSRSTDQSTNVLATYRGPRRGTDTYKDGLFNQPKPQPDSSSSSHRGLNRKDVWRPVRSKR